MNNYNLDAATRHAAWTRGRLFNETGNYIECIAGILGAHGAHLPLNYDTMGKLVAMGDTLREACQGASKRKLIALCNVLAELEGLAEKAMDKQ